MITVKKTVIPMNYINIKTNQYSGVFLDFNIYHPRYNSTFKEDLGEKPGQDVTPLCSQSKFLNITSIYEYHICYTDF